MNIEEICVAAKQLTSEERGELIVALIDYTIGVEKFA